MDILQGTLYLSGTHPEQNVPLLKYFVPFRVGSKVISTITHT